MPHMTEARATSAIDEQYDLLTAHPTTVLATPRRRPAALLYFLRNCVRSWMGRHTFESKWIRPDLPRWETPNDILARQHTYLYIRSLSG